MKSVYKSSALLIIFLLLYSLVGVAQTESRKKAVREKMWGNTDADFNRTAVPERWKNESAVVLCKSMEYQVKKEAVVLYIYENLYTRTRIKLLDQAAVKEYSEMSFAASKSMLMDIFGATNASNVYTGIKIIKPNGTEREVSQDAAVTMEAQKEVSNVSYSKDKYNKIAIPNLEPGDIIDYYYCVEQQSIGGGFGRIIYPLAGKYPIAKQKLDVHIMRKCYISAKSMNGAPELKHKPNAEGDVYALVDENRDKVNYDQHWFYPYRSLPTVNMQAYYVQKKSGWMNHFLGEQGEVHSKVSENNLLQYVNLISTQNKKYYPYSVSILEYMNQYLHKEKDPEVLASESYNYWRQRTFAAGFEDDALYDRSTDHQISNYRFIINLSRILKKKKIDHDIIITTPREISDVKDLTLLRDLSMLIRVNTPQPFYMGMFGRYTQYNEVSQIDEGNNAYAVNMMQKTKRRTIQKITIPASGSEKNGEEVAMEVSISPQDPSRLLVKRKVTLKGLYRFTELGNLITAYDYLYDCQPEKYSIKLYEKQNMNKKKKAEVEQKIIQKKEQDNKDRLLRMKEALESEIDGKVISYDTFELLQTGLWPDKPEVKYQDEYTLEGLLVNNGPNYLLNAGKLIGKQIELHKEDLVRKDDIYMPYARSFAYSVSITIPTGYEVKGLEKFNQSVSNATGGFVCNAVQKEDKIVITTRKYYNHNYEPAAKWSDMVAFLEATYQFTQQKLLLKKI